MNRLKACVSLLRKRSFLCPLGLKLRGSKNGYSLCPLTVMRGSLEKAAGRATGEKLGSLGTV